MRIDRNYIRLREAPTPVLVDLAALAPAIPASAKERMSMGAKAWGLDLTTWAPATLLAWYKSRTGGGWLALVDVEVATSNRLHTVRLRTLVPAVFVKQPPMG